MQNDQPILSTVTVWESIYLTPEQLMPIIMEHTQAHEADIDLTQPEQCCVSVMCWRNLQLVIIDRWTTSRKTDAFEVLPTRHLDIMTLADAREVPSLWESIREVVPTVMQPSGKAYLN